MLPKDIRTHQIAGSPIVHIREKRIQGQNCLSVVFHRFNQKPVEIIFLVVPVGQRLQKFRSFRCLGKVLRKFSQCWRPDANDGF